MSINTHKELNNDDDDNDDDDNDDDDDDNDNNNNNNLTPFPKQQEPISVTKFLVQTQNCGTRSLTAACQAKTKRFYLCISSVGVLPNGLPYDEGAKKL
jgi:hypothetical protein